MMVITMNNGGHNNTTVISAMASHDTGTDTLKFETMSNDDDANHTNAEFLHYPVRSGLMTP